MSNNWIWIVIPITAIFAGVARTWIRARHGYPLDPWSRRRERHSGPDDLRTLKDALAGRDATIAKLEERVRVLERIATDKASALRDEIDKLRD